MPGMVGVSTLCCHSVSPGRSGSQLNKDVEMSKRQTTQHNSKQQLEPGEVQVQKPERQTKEGRAGL